ncbi:MAG: hypothetical protein LUQ66_06600 [Methanoregula sp.]|nr:hypothetical protein [Methanoregula sp.]
MVKTLFFLEDPKKIDWVIQDSVKSTGQSVFISLSATASYAYERYQIPYKSIRDFGGGEERYQQGLENFQRFDRIVTILDKELTLHHNNLTLTPARYSIYNLKILFDTLWNAIQILKQIIDIEQPDFIRLYAIPRVRSVNKVCVFSNNESIYTEVLNMSGWNVQIEIIQETEPDRIDQGITGRSYTRFSRLMDWIKEQDLLFNLGLISKREGIGLATLALYYHIIVMRRNPVLIYNSGYNWDDSLIELFREGMVPVYRIRDEFLTNDITDDTASCEEVRNICGVHPGMREFDTILGIDVSTFFFERLSEIVGRALQESVVAYTYARKKIRRKNIQCLLLAACDTTMGHAIVQAAHDTEIPVVSWQHGGAGYSYHPLMSFIEFVNSDWHFVFGEGVATSYLSTSKCIGLKKIPRFVPVGSSSLDIFDRNKRKTAIKPDNGPVVYITTAYLRNIYMNSGKDDLGVFDEHLWDIQQHILNLAKNNPDKEFIIKLHPTHIDKEPLNGFVIDHNIRNVKLITSEMTIRELTDIAGIMIFDLISTGILQVLTSELPVFVYPGLYKVDPDPLMQLMKRAYVSYDKNRFVAMIQQFIDVHSVDSFDSVDVKNTDFLIRYGTDPVHHNSAVEAVTALKKILLQEYPFPRE